MFSKLNLYAEMFLYMFLLISNTQIFYTIYFHNSFGRICNPQVKYLQSEITVAIIQKSTMVSWTSTNITYGVNLLFDDNFRGCFLIAKIRKHL
jgi:hypothetical protein